MKKISFRVWRKLVVNQEANIEIEMPEYVAVDPYAPDSVCGAYVKSNREGLPWAETSRSEKSIGYNRTSEDTPIDDWEDTPIYDDGRE